MFRLKLIREMIKMGKVLDYIRSLFCKHEWELISKEYVYENSYSNRPLGERRTYLCEKCMRRKNVKTW